MKLAMTRRELVAGAGAALLFMTGSTRAQDGRKPGEPVAPLRMMLGDWPEMTELYRILRPNWEKLGVQVIAQQASQNSMTAQTTGEHNAPEMVAGAWGGAPDRIDPDFFLTEFFHSSRAVKGGQNFGNYRNPEYDQIVDAQRVEMDEKRRADLVHQAQRILQRDRPGLVLYYSDLTNPYRADRVSGMVPVMGSGVAFSYIPWSYIEGRPEGRSKALKVTFQYDIATLNPLATTEVQNAGMLRWIYAPMAIRDKDLKVIPWAAESWTFQDDTTLELVLRDGMTFHDGKPVTIDDLKFTFDYIEKWKFPLLARITDNVQSTEIVGDRTLRIRLRQPFAPFVSNVLTSFFIIPKHVWEAVGADGQMTSPADWANEAPVGYGPYSLKEWRKGEYLHLASNQSWFQPPNFSEIYWMAVPSVDTMIGMLESGQSDVMAWNVTPSQIKRLSNPNIKTGRSASHAPRELRFNLEIAPFDDVAFRNAFALATDRPQLVNTLLDGAATPGNDSYVSPALEISDPGIEPPEFNIEKARLLLQEAGYTWDGEGRLCYPK